MTAPATPPTNSAPRLFSRGTWREAKYVAEALRTETTGGLLLLLAAVVAMTWANTPWHTAYESLRDLKVGPEALHLNLSLGAWAADGLLAVFFLVAGIEVKREFVAGDLKDPRKAAVPVTAAVCGVAVPASLYAAVALASGEDGVMRGWAIPTATDIAFALGVLAVIANHLPSALRSFLLTLAVVDDLIAITIIALFYTSGMDPVPLLFAIIPLTIWAVLLRKGFRNPWVLGAIGIVAWALVHASGVHATVAGILLGLLVPVAREGKYDEDEHGHSLAERIEHGIRPFSAGVAVPVFAFFASGVHVAGGLGGIAQSLRDPAALGVIAGLVAGKCIGIFGGTYLLARFTKAELDDDLAWTDVLGLSLLGGVGFTVSLLVAELSFGQGSERDDHVRLGILTASLLAAVLAAIVLKARDRHYRRIWEEEQIDEDRDGIPDVYQRPNG